MRDAVRAEVNALVLKRTNSCRVEQRKLISSLSHALTPPICPERETPSRSCRAL